MEPGRKERISSPVSLRRFLIIIIVALSFVALLWGALAYWSTPSPGEAARPPAARFDMPVGDSTTPKPSNVDYSRLDARLQQLMDKPGMVGLAVAVVEGGEIRFIKGYGRTFTGGDEPVTPNTVFRWASLSKGVAADLVALLAQEGKLSLEEPVNTHAASLRLPGGNEAFATVTDLLSHRLGLFGHAQDAKLEDGMDPRFLRASLATLHNICSPGACHAYQNVAYDAASEIVERVTGQPYGEVVRERLFAPLGMNTASTSRLDLIRSPSWARPHVGTRTEEPNDIYYRVPAAGGVNGSIKDLAIWMLAQMGLAHDVLPAPVLAAVQAPHIRTPGENFRRRKFRERTPISAYGLGWRMFDYAGHRVVGHHGGVRGYRSMILFDPRQRSGIVALWNSSSSAPNAIEYEVMDMIYRLDRRDWLDLDGGPEGAAEPESNAQAESEGNN
jgi:beta-lactamase class C